MCPKRPFALCFPARGPYNGAERKFPTMLTLALLSLASALAHDPAHDHGKKIVCELPGSSRGPIVFSDFRADPHGAIAYPHKVENPILTSMRPGARPVEAKFLDELVILKAVGDNHSAVQVAMTYLDVASDGGPALVRIWFTDSPSHMGETAATSCTTR